MSKNSELQEENLSLKRQLGKTQAEVEATHVMLEQTKSEVAKLRALHAPNGVAPVNVAIHFSAA